MAVEQAFCLQQHVLTCRKLHTHHTHALQAVVPSAGHFQFLDEQSTLDRAVCAAGRTSDATVRAFSQVRLPVFHSCVCCSRRTSDATVRVFSQVRLPVFHSCVCSSK